MNQQQKKYVLQELNSNYNNTKQLIRDKHTTPEVKLNTLEKHEALQNMEVTLKEKHELDDSYYTREGIYNYFTFHAEKEEVFDKESYAEDVKELDAVFKKAEREVMLGDSSEALKLLEQFEETAKKLTE